MRALETCLYAEDLAAAEAFYGEVLGLELHSKVEGRHLFFRLDGSMLLIFNPAASAQPGDVPPHAGKPGGHACLALPREQTDEWEARLRGLSRGGFSPSSTTRFSGFPAQRMVCGKGRRNQRMYSPRSRASGTARTPAATSAMDAASG